MHHNKSSVQILWEDDRYFAIEKPSGIASMAPEGSREKNCLSLATEYLTRFKGKKARAALVHRLDRETSGVMLFAKDAMAKKALMDGWQEAVSLKQYTAIVEGIIKDKGIIDCALKENKAFIVFPAKPNEVGAKSARTEYSPLKIGKAHTLISVSIDTGRKHQIRAHMKSINHSVAGDKKYGAKTDPIRRIALHSTKIVFTHPFTKAQICIECAIPSTFLSIFS